MNHKKTYTLPIKSVTSEIGPFTEGGCLSCRVSRVKLYFSLLKRRTEICIDGEVNVVDCNICGKGGSGAEMGSVTATI
jgi:hypothetical protein